MEKLEQYKNKIMIGGLLLLLLISGISIFFYCHQKGIRKKENKVEEMVLEENLESDISNLVEEENQVQQDEIKTYLVDIKGEVKKPGIYKVLESARVQDVINLAGGVTKNADTNLINLSKKVFDEMVIIVYSEEEVAIDTSSKSEINAAITACPTKTPILNDACIQQGDLVGSEGEQTNDNHLISINYASVEELTQLPGIGESKAISIIKYRTENGLFTNLEDLKKVSGIGDSAFEKIKPYITL